MKQIKRWLQNHLPIYTAEPSQTQPVRDTKEINGQVSLYHEIRFYLYRWGWKRQNQEKEELII